MEREVLVYVDFEEAPCLVGRLWSRIRKGRESATFEYDKTWLEHPERFALEPALTLGLGPHHTTHDRALFGALGDSAPDRWGRVLMRRAERRRAEADNRMQHTLREIDYLLFVDDEARQGALRFTEKPGGPFLAAIDSKRIPPLIDLHKLLAASEHVTGDTETEEDLRLLLAPGSSPGGARPKASIWDRDGHLAIAKFPHQGDDLDIVTWEALALTLAKEAGISTPDWRCEVVAGKPVLLLHRFDRDRNGRRTPFLSALSMVGAKDNEQHSYLEIVDAIRQHGAYPEADLHELWRRVLFSVLISNTDDHLRNHGFLYERGKGWRLSPAYDLNPVPTDIKPRILSTTIDLDDATASLDLVLSVADYFKLSPADIQSIIRKVATAVSGWRKVASGLGLNVKEIERMASAFEHDDLTRSLSI